MNKIILASLFLFVSITNLSAQNDSIPQAIEQQEGALRLATKWVNLITEGKDIEALLTISGLPFALDRSELVNSNEALKSFYVEAAKNIGTGTSPKITTEIVGSRHKIIEDIIPLNILIIKFTVLEGELKDDTKSLAVSISGNEMKIVGFSD